MWLVYFGKNNSNVTFSIKLSKLRIKFLGPPYNSINSVKTILGDPSIIFLRLKSNPQYWMGQRKRENKIYIYMVK